LLAPALDTIVGVVEHGLFLNLADEAIVAFEGGVKALRCELRS
jgi:ribose 5-phosphate isomerase